MNLEEMGRRAKEAARQLNGAGVTEKNKGLEAVAQALIRESDYLLGENETDMAAGRENGMSQGLLDRLQLTKERIQGMAGGLMQIVALDDPVGEVLSMKKRPNGLMVGKKRVPLGVVGIIYESRPNVTADAFGLCFKTGNAVILKGGSDAIHSNMAITKVIRDALSRCGLNPDSVQLLESTDRETTSRLMKLNQYIDVLIPRGGAG